MTTTFTPWEGLIGGLMIGAATVIWLWLYGRTTGISGIIHGATLRAPRGERSWRILYLLGLVCGGLLYQWLWRLYELPGTHFTAQLQVGWPLMIAAGLLVGFGTRLGSGCTSGHGVCGLSRLSVRSLAATLTFMIFGGLTTFVVRHWAGT